MKSQMTLLINHPGYPALLHFALIALISMSKFDAIFLDLCKSPEMVFRLNSRSGFLIFFLIYLCCYYTFIVENDFCVC